MGWDTISVNHIPQPMDQIFARPDCTDQVFAFWLNRDLDHNAIGGEMTLCGTDPAHYRVRILACNLEVTVYIQTVHVQI